MIFVFLVAAWNHTRTSDKRKLNGPRTLSSRPWDLARQFDWGCSWTWQPARSVKFVRGFNFFQLIFCLTKLLHFVQSFTIRLSSYTSSMAKNVQGLTDEAMKLAYSISSYVCNTSVIECMWADRDRLVKGGGVKLTEWLIEFIGKPLRSLARLRQILANARA